MASAGRWLLVALVVALAGPLCAAQLETEDQALAALQSAGTVTEKEAACRRLKEIGTAKSVTTLKTLLSDESLAQWAVDALETMPAREAGETLLQALPEASGKTKAMVVFALGVRQEVGAVQPLTKLALDADTVVAVAAVKALGRIGDAASQAALWKIRPAVTGNVRTAATDALLVCADQLLGAGRAEAASEVYGSLRASDEPEQVRLAAFRGLVLCAGNRKASLLVEALTAGDAAEQVMAIQLARELPDAEITTSLASSVARTGPLIQVALLEALRQRGDPAAAAVIMPLVRSGEASIRIAALKTVGELGNASHVGLLAELAASGSGDERAEARQALVTLHRGDVSQGIFAELRRAKPEAQVELVQALGRRMDRGVASELARLAAGDDSKLGVASLQALEKLADDSQMPALLELLVRAKDETQREAAVSAFATVAGRSRRPAEFSRLALKAMPGAVTETRCALLDAAAQTGGLEVLEALRVAVKDSEAAVRATALRAMAEYTADAARPDLLKLARESSVEADRATALGGYWRLVEAMTERPQTERLAAVREGLAVSKTPGEQKLGLARLAELRGTEALELAQHYRRDAAVRAEAEAACLQIVSRLDAANVALAETALRSLATEAENKRVRDEAKALSAKVEAQAGCLAPWLVCGPYRQPGKEAQQLFDIQFGPERSDTLDVKWRPLPMSGGLTNYGFADLTPEVGGDHCVVYLKARVFCPQAQPVALDIGTDDGVKLWLNGALVHANNAVRGFTPGADKAQASLREGWNDFLVKVTQHTAGCAAQVRVRATDGAAISGLRVEAKE